MEEEEEEEKPEEEGEADDDDETDPRSPLRQKFGEDLNSKKPT